MKVGMISCSPIKSRSFGANKNYNNTNKEIDNKQNQEKVVTMPVATFNTLKMLALAGLLATTAVVPTACEPEEIKPTEEEHPLLQSEPQVIIKDMISSLGLAVVTNKNCALKSGDIKKISYTNSSNYQKEYILDKDLSNKDTTVFNIKLTSPSGEVTENTQRISIKKNPDNSLRVKYQSFYPSENDWETLSQSDFVKNSDNTVSAYDIICGARASFATYAGISPNSVSLSNEDGYETVFKNILIEAEK